mmetsp:Transcript_27249/g.71783  ORF Transcript_27249/g.71783 Transcript_27249/m.71783 type:complete len:158 (-) Transcript_27249:1411-1884(-)
MCTNSSTVRAPNSGETARVRDNRRCVGTVAGHQKVTTGHRLLGGRRAQTNWQKRASETNRPHTSLLPLGHLAQGARVRTVFLHIWKETSKLRAAGSVAGVNAQLSGVCKSLTSHCPPVGDLTSSLVAKASLLEYSTSAKTLLSLQPILPEVPRVPAA